MRCRMRCGDIWRCGGPIKKRVPVESVSIVGWDSTMSFEAQEQPYSIDYSINVSPETATNKSVTIVSSNPEVINVDTYDSSAVTFSIEGDGEATITITSQDNPEINTTYSVTITSPVPPFTPMNSILVEPTRGNAILKFFATDGESVDYVQARLGVNNKLTYVTYYGACEGNTYCEEIFNNEDIKTELGAKIGEYIDTYGIPASGVLEFAPDMWVAIEGFFQGEQTIEDVVSAIEEGEAVEPSVCRVTITANNSERAHPISPSTIDGTYNGTIEVEQSDASRGRLKVTIEDGSHYTQTDVMPNTGYIFDKREIDGVEASLGDVITLKGDVSAVGFLAPALEDISISDMGIEELTLGTTYYFPYTLSPSGAPVKGLSLEIDNPELANASIDNGNVVIEPLQEGRVSFYLYDEYTGIQSNTLTFDITGGGGGDCPVYISDYTAEELNIPLSETYSSTFMLSYDCATPDYSNLSVTSSNEDAVLVTLYAEGEYFDIEAIGEGESEITFTDGENTYVFNVYVESGEPIDGDGAIRLDDDEMEGGYGIAGFNYNGTLEDLMLYARNIETGEEYSSDVIYVEAGEQEEGSEWKYYISVKYYYPESADDLIDEFEIVFAYHSGEELAVWPVYAYIDYNFEESEALESRVNVLRRLSVTDGTLEASYRGDTVDIANPGNPDPGSLEFFAWVNSVTPYDEWYTDNRLICGETGYFDEPVYTYLDNFKPLWVTRDVAVPKYLFNLEGQSGDAGRDPENPIELSTYGGHTLIRFNYHREDATNFSNITVEVNDENVLRTEIIHTGNGEGVIEVEAVGPGRGELRLNCTDMEGRYTFSTETLYFSVSDEHDFAD